MVDPFEMAEGIEKLDELIAQGPPRTRRKKNGGPADVKATWVKVGWRMDPAIKRKLKAAAQSLNVPVEELLHLALVRFLDGFDPDDFKPRAISTHKTLLDW